jgi:MFS family permease
MGEEELGLPYARLAILSVCTFAGCYNMTTMMPFIPMLVRDLGKADDLREPGFYAGYLVSANQLGRILTSVLWGRYSDTHGRKPVLLYGLAMTALTALLFGLAARAEPLLVAGYDIRFWFCVAMRLLNGLFDFIFGAAKTTGGAVILILRPCLFLWRITSEEVYRGA